MFKNEKCTLELNTKKSFKNHDKEYNEIRPLRYRTFVYCIIICSLRSHSILEEKKMYKMLSVGNKCSWCFKNHSNIILESKLNFSLMTL